MQPCSRYPTLTRAAGKAIQVTAEIEAGLQAPTLQRDLPHECRQKRAGPQNSAQRTHLVVHGLELGGIGVGLQQLRVKQLLLLHGIQLTLRMGCNSSTSPSSCKVCKHVFLCCLLALVLGLELEGWGGGEQGQDRHSWVAGTGSSFLGCRDRTVIFRLLGHDRHFRLLGQDHHSWVAGTGLLGCSLGMFGYKCKERSASELYCPRAMSVKQLLLLNCMQQSKALKHGSRSNCRAAMGSLHITHESWLACACISWMWQSSLSKGGQIPGFGSSKQASKQSFCWQECERLF